ncbi:MAG TPA: hypothetical protein VFV72_04505 [Candidatus Limnocylindrales bacterium]|nr:hypothetical protein [Candidatus Limnocylindrales bacterium]
MAVVVGFWLETAVSPYAAIRSALVAIGLALLVTVVAGALLRSILLGGIVATALIGLAWTKQLLDIPASLLDRGQGAVAVVAGVALLGIVILVVRILFRRRSMFSRVSVTRILNRGAALLLVATVAFGIINGRLVGAAEDLRQGVSLDAWEDDDGLTTDVGPDLYAILLDGYPRADVLDYAFDIDNSDFVDALEERGFEVAGESHSDYLWTHVSVPSALNMAYVEQIPAMLDVIEERQPRQPTLRRTISDNAAFDEAREAGYRTVAVGAGFEEVAPRQADVYVDGGHLNEFEISLLVSTWAGDLLGLVAPDFASSQQRARILYNLDVLPEIAAASDDESDLVFAHVPAPHQPTVFGENGSAVEVPISDGWFADSPQERGEDPVEFRERYRAQLPYLNERILATIDGILAESDEPPVIVLFADHGSASDVDWNVTQPDDADPARLLERTGTLFASLTPNQSDVFPDDISPVDLFRLLFDAYLGTDYGRATPPEGGGQVAPVDASVLGADE